MLKEIANRERVTVDIALDDLKKYDKNKTVIDHIESNTLRYVGLFSKAIDNVMPERDANAQVEEDSIDVLAEWRYTLSLSIFHLPRTQSTEYMDDSKWILNCQITTNF